jgi:uncharacterized protein
MSLKARIADDMKAALRARESDRLEAIRLLRAALQRREVDERVELGDAEVIDVIGKLIKQFTRGGRSELAARESAQVAVFSAYLPEALDDAGIDAAIADAVASTGAQGVRDMGKVMAALREPLQGRADMGEVSRRVRARLQTE